VGRDIIRGDVVRWHGNISFLEEIKSEDGTLVKDDQPIDIRGKVLVFDGGSGSTVGSYNIYNLKLRGNAPSAMIMAHADAIITIGCIMADIVLIHDLEDDGMSLLENGVRVEIDPSEGTVRIRDDIMPDKSDPMIEILRELSNEVNRRIAEDQNVRELITSKNRTIQLEFKDDKTYVLEVRDGVVMEPYEGTLDDPTLKVRTDAATLQKLIDKKLNPLMAYAMRKIKVEGPIDDIMILKDLF
jgi:predicted aconitase with swiveling domain/putative sterol carrier protein